MSSCELPTSEMFNDAIHLYMGGGELTFEQAQRAAYSHAKSYSDDPLLLSWFDRKHGAYSPSIVECCDRGQPSWLSYARSRGGKLTIDINDEDYIFVFKGTEGLS